MANMHPSSGQSKKERKKEIERNKETKKERKRGRDGLYHVLPEGIPLV
jgi:hypothetical protein